MGEEFLGVGWMYPVQLDEVGEVRFARYEEDVREAIWIILSTAPGERVMRPDFGCGIYEFVFSTNTARILGLIQSRVEDALLRWEPRIDVEGVTVESAPDDPVKLLIRVDYRVHATDSRFNLVYPFYLQREQSL